MLLACCGAAHAQTPDTAAIRGTASGPNRRPLAGVHLSLQDQQHPAFRTQQSNTGGGFDFEGLPIAQPLAILATSPGLAETSSRVLTLSAGRAATVQLRMAVSSVKAEVIVTGTSEDIRTDE